MLYKSPLCVLEPCLQLVFARARAPFQADPQRLDAFSMLLAQRGCLSGKLLLEFGRLGCTRILGILGPCCSRLERGYGRACTDQLCVSCRRAVSPTQRESHARTNGGNTR